MILEITIIKTGCLVLMYIPILSTVVEIGQPSTILEKKYAVLVSLFW